MNYLTFNFFLNEDGAKITNKSVKTKIIIQQFKVNLSENISKRGNL